MAARFRVQQVGGSLNDPGCPDPNSAKWEWTEPGQVSLTGRLVQQGRLRVTLAWEIMDDGAFGNLMDVYLASRAAGQRVDAITVPPFTGHDNASWPTFYGAGTPGGYIRMMMPEAERNVLHARNVTVVFEDVVENE